MTKGPSRSSQLPPSRHNGESAAAVPVPSSGKQVARSREGSTRVRSEASNAICQLASVAATSFTRTRKGRLPLERKANSPATSSPGSLRTFSASKLVSGRKLTETAFELFSNAVSSPLSNPCESKASQQSQLVSTVSERETTTRGDSGVDFSSKDSSPTSTTALSQSPPVSISMDSPSTLSSPCSFSADSGDSSADLCGRSISVKCNESPPTTKRSQQLRRQALRSGQPMASRGGRPPCLPSAPTVGSPSTHHHAAELDPADEEENDNAMADGPTATAKDRVATGPFSPAPSTPRNVTVSSDCVMPGTIPVNLVDTSLLQPFDIEAVFSRSSSLPRMDSAISFTDSPPTSGASPSASVSSSASTVDPVQSFQLRLLEKTPVGSLLLQWMLPHNQLECLALEYEQLGKLLKSLQQRRCQLATYIAVTQQSMNRCGLPVPTVDIDVNELTRVLDPEIVKGLISDRTVNQSALCSMPASAQRPATPASPPPSLQSPLVGYRRGGGPRRGRGGRLR